MTKIITFILGGGKGIVPFYVIYFIIAASCVCIGQFYDGPLFGIGIAFFILMLISVMYSVVRSINR